MNIQLEPAFVLHAIPYRDTSLIVNFFTKNHGKISVIARSARGNRSRFKGCLSPFSPLLISLRGKSDLMQLNAVEPESAAYFLQEESLFNGMYLNELLMRLIQRFDPYPALFEYYRDTLSQLQATQEPQKILRIFEKKFLFELGYGLQLGRDTSGQEVLPDTFYAYQLDRGIIPCQQNNESFRGSHLLAIENNNFESSEILKDAKRLMRLIFNALLGSYQLKTRELFS